jgi:hypothetical protein
MPQLIWLAVLIGISCAGCTSTPKVEKPLITLCTLDYPNSEAICSEGGNTVRVILEFMDKSIVVTPHNWEKLQNYLDALEVNNAKIR